MSKKVTKSTPIKAENNSKIEILFSEKPSLLKQSIRESTQNHKTKINSK
jgi:hypothetical protein